MSEPNLDLDRDVLAKFPAEFAWNYRVIPKSLIADHCVLFSDIRHEESALQELSIVLNTTINIELVDSTWLSTQLGLFFRKNQSQQDIKRFKPAQAELFIEQLIKDALYLHSSDIHLEVYEENARVRIRIDGLLVERYRIDKLDYPALINRIKILSRLDISEKRLPQDGRISIHIEGTKLDLRVSILPTLHGEKIVLRLLNRDASDLSLEKLGMNEVQLNLFKDAIKKPHGIILISGPTGSGKTSTLYATLKLLNEEKRNILTVEDPIEYTLPGVNQVQMKESIGLDFASTLRAFLRQDPDVIMLGEIRDIATAEIAVRAALTGHLVLSTIHTNSAWDTISRLVNMGIPSFLLASTITMSIAQRLVRKLCVNCCIDAHLEIDELPISFREKAATQLTHKIAKGCNQCHFTGYQGRIALYEIVPINFEIAEAVRQNTTKPEELFQRLEIKSISDQAFSIYRSGITSLDEIYSMLL
jgi:type IV pilus assembly protein PilB